MVQKSRSLGPQQRLKKLQALKKTGDASAKLGATPVVRRWAGLQGAAKDLMTHGTEVQVVKGAIKKPAQLGSLLGFKVFADVTSAEGKRQRLLGLASHVSGKALELLSPDGIHSRIDLKKDQVHSLFVGTHEKPIELGIVTANRFDAQLKHLQVMHIKAQQAAEQQRTPFKAFGVVTFAVETEGEPKKIVTVNGAIESAGVDVGPYTDHNYRIKDRSGHTHHVSTSGIIHATLPKSLEANALLARRTTSSLEGLFGKPDAFERWDEANAEVVFTPKKQVPPHLRRRVGWV